MVRFTRLSPQVRLTSTGLTADQQFGGMWHDAMRGIEALHTPLPALADLAPSATLADVITGFNALLDNLRAAGRMAP